MLSSSKSLLHASLDSDYYLIGEGEASSLKPPFFSLELSFLIETFKEDSRSGGELLSTFKDLKLEVSFIISYFKSAISLRVVLAALFYY